jgi:hypothetical protein
VLRDTMVSQGLGTYTTLVRGKQAMVRLYLSLPTCAAGKAIQITGASLAVTVNGATTTISPTPAIVSPFPSLSNLPTKPPLVERTPSDPIFIVPASVLAPAANTARQTVTFTPSVSYGAAAPATLAATSRTLERRSNALRVLVVPMASALTAADSATLQDVLTTVSRTFPLPDGTRLGPLTDIVGGLRYGINAGVISVTTPFCGTSTSFNAIKVQAAQFLTSYNALNPTAQADRVLGVINGTAGVGSAANPNCAEGMASVSSPEAWVRLSPLAGGIATMELAHTFGLVPVPRNDGGYHSFWYNAANNACALTGVCGSTGDLGRAYNLLSFQRIVDDRTAMYFSPPGWGNDNVLLEPEDYSNLLCQLGGQTTTECTTSSTAGTAAGVAATLPAPAFNLNAESNGTVIGTHVLESYVQRTPHSPPGPLTSHWTIKQFGAGGALLHTDYVTPSNVETAHAGPEHANDGTPSTVLISVSIPLVANAVKATLNYDAIELYAADNTGAAVVLTPTASVTTGTPPGGSTSAEHSLIAPKIARSSVKADFCLLSDTTGSMGDAIGGVQTNAGSLLSTLTTGDPRFCVADYKDVGSSYVFNLGAAINPDSTSTTAVTNAINAWSPPGGGGDTPEAGLYALHKLADVTATGYRSGSERSIFWFGDAPSHDPVCAGLAGVDATSNVTEASAIADLKAAGIKVYAIDVGNLNGAPDSGYATCPTASGLTAGAAQRIATATGGLYATSSPSGVTDSIIDSLTYAPDTIAATGTCTGGLGIVVVPSSVTVKHDTTVGHTATISVPETAAPGNYSCTVKFTVNGASNEALADWTIPVNVSALTGPHQLIGWSGPPGQLYDVALNCDGTHNILAVGLVSTTFETQTTCPGGGGTYEIAANTGWDQTVVPAVGTGTLPTPTPATSAVRIESPADGAVFSQFDAIAIHGTGISAGVPTNDLHWSLDGVHVSDLPQDVLQGVAVGSHTLTLSGPNSAEASVSFSVTNDADHDGLTAAYEAILDSCRPAGAPLGETDPTNGAADYDGDGIPNADEQFTAGGPCVPETSFRAFGLFLPARFSVSSTEPTVSLSGVLLLQHDLTQIIGSTVRIVSINGITIPGGIPARNWFAIGGLGGAVFPRPPIAQFLKSNELVGRKVPIRIEGNGPGWSFFTVVSTNVIP